MQIYIVGIGQCGTSVALDVLAELTGFVRSKDLPSSLREGAATVASNELAERLHKDLARTHTWKVRVAPWLARAWRRPSGRRAFNLPKVAIIDGGPAKSVKEALEEFARTVAETMGGGEGWGQLVDLIAGTKVIGCDRWADDCANGVVGEALAAANLRPDALRNDLGVDDRGRLTGEGKPVSIFLVVSSGGVARGSGCGVYLSKTDALLSSSNGRAQANPRGAAFVANAIVLPSIQASSDDRKSALNAGRALARHCNMIAADGKPNRPAATILFSNPPHEADSRASQRLNDYMAEFAIRIANFASPCDAGHIACDVDEGELGFLLGKTSVLAMSHLAQDDWAGGGLGAQLVERAFANVYEGDGDEPHGLSVEEFSRPEEDGAASLLSGASSAMVAIGVPSAFKDPLSIAEINGRLRAHSGSSLGVGIRTFAYGAERNLELTVFLRYRRMSACPLAMHFVRQYVGGDSNAEGDSVREVDYISARAQQDDDYAEVFEEFAADIAGLDGAVDVGMHWLRRPASRGHAPRATSVDYRNVITVEPGKRGGMPCVRGMRITVYDVLGYLASGMSHREVLDEFPYLCEADILACLSYAADQDRSSLAAGAA